MDKVPTLAHFALEPECENYSFLEQAFEELEHSCYSVLTDSVDNQNWMHPLVRLIPCLLQSLQGLYAQLIPFQIFWTAAFSWHQIINYGARLGHFIYMYHWQVKFQPLG